MRGKRAPRATIAQMHKLNEQARKEVPARIFRHFGNPELKPFDIRKAQTPGQKAGECSWCTARAKWWVESRQAPGWNQYRTASWVKAACNDHAANWWGVHWRSTLLRWMYVAKQEESSRSRYAWSPVRPF